MSKIDCERDAILFCTCIDDDEPGPDTWDCYLFVVAHSEAEALRLSAEESGAWPGDRAMVFPWPAVFANGAFTGRRSREQAWTHDDHHPSNPRRPLPARSRLPA